ncbi:MAG: cyclic nucleotide-binding domain-containing protein [Alphaproteobacteria bacterium]|nr:cyclic nucleotide-binding domain-containing protein [Alphaproteobacteria bacterium]
MQVVDQKIFLVDDPIFREGDPGNAAYIVKKGNVQIWKMEDGEKRILGNIGRGGVFGEMALVDSQPRMASATAVEPTTCLIITDRSFREKLDSADAFIVALLRIFCRNIRAMQTPN